MSKTHDTPISYYGGKKNMLKHILPLIPTHSVYTEPFFGGGTVFFAKEPVEHEVINDTNNLVINFYKVLQNDFQNLKQKIEETLFSRSSYSTAMVVCRMPHLFSELVQAWGFYIACNMGFLHIMGSWGFDKYGKRQKTFLNKKIKFTDSFAKRIENAAIECSDACHVIKLYDSPETFHYLDPPYIETDQGHYSGYTENDYRKLVETLVTIKGKFLLSSYPSKILNEFINKHGWHSKLFTKPLSAHKITDGSKRPVKTEVLTANYPI
ncbi:MAG: DNA adenine methylase [Bacteroidetes bacterium]|nr:DNA adenine methylase [Bacteroidota bacterium]